MREILLEVLLVPQGVLNLPASVSRMFLTTDLLMGSTKALFLHTRLYVIPQFKMKVMTCKSFFYIVLQPRTILTNLQRGNVQTESVVSDPFQLSFHQKAGKGELTRTDMENSNFSALYFHF